MALGVTAYSEAPFGAEASDVIVYPSGNLLTAQENSGFLNVDVTVTLTGKTLQTFTGQALGGSRVEVPLSGTALSSNLGTVSETPIGQQVNVTGFELTTNVNNPTHDTLTAFGEAPFATLSPATFNIPVDVEATTGGILVGTNLPMSLGSVAVTASANVTLTGQAMAMQENAPTVTADANVAITGQAITSTLGNETVDAITFASATGNLLSIAEGSMAGSANADVGVTGQAMTMQENAPTVTADSNVTLTALPITSALGTAILDANTLVDLTGQAMTMQEGQATADDASAELTGIAMAISQGSVENIMWSPVSTGNAPTDPPGWKEVA